jgi:hypothetical protein
LVVFLVRHPEGKGTEETSDFYASTYDVAPTILGRNWFVWTRDERYVMFGSSDRAEMRPYDVWADQEQRENLAAQRPEVVEKMFNDYVLEDAGAELPAR